MSRIAFITFILLISSAFASECSIVFNTHLACTSLDLLSPQDLIKSSTCSSKVQEKIWNELKDIDGQINLSSLSLDFKHKVSLSPRVIRIESLADLIKENMKLSKQYRFTNLKMIGQKTCFSLEKKRLITHCTDCSFPGDKNFRLQINSRWKPYNNETFWISGELQIQSEALVVKQSLAPRTLLDESLIEKRTIYTKNPEKLFTNLKTYRSYQTNKAISAGTAITFSDLTAAQLVRTGKMVDILYESPALSLSMKGRSLQNGRRGELIAIRNLKSGKKIIGKVIDFNKVKIEL